MGWFEVQGDRAPLQLSALDFQSRRRVDWAKYERAHIFLDSFGIRSYFMSVLTLHRGRAQ